MFQERKKMSFEILISNLLANFGRLMLANLIFAVPFIGSVILSWVVYKNILDILPLAVVLVFIIASPFYAGVVRISRDLSQNIRPKGMFRTFFSAVKENGLRFLLIGIISYIAVLGCYFGIGVYSAMAANVSGIFYVLMFFVVLFCVFFLFFFFASPLMTVSFELKVKDVFKNSALMTFGEFKKNFFATVGILFYLAISLFPMIAIPNFQSLLSLETTKIILIVYSVVAFGMLIPAHCNMIISHYLYPNMKAVISGNIDNVVLSDGAPDVKETKAKPAIITEEITPPPVDLKELKMGDGDEYIFYQGKMIKRKTLINLLEEKEKNNE